jgi:hypothetical protein
LRTVGLRDRATLETLFNLADALTSDRNDTKPLDLYKKINDPFIELFGENHPQTLRMRNACAALLCNVDQVEKGLPLLEDVSRLAVEHYGPDTHDALQFRQALAEQSAFAGRV